MSGTPTASFLDAMRKKRESIRFAAEGMLMEVRAERGPDAQLADGELERLRHMQEDMRNLDQRIKEYGADLQRAQLPDHLAHLGGGQRAGRINCRPGREVMPLDFGMEELREAHGKVLRQEPVLLESRASNSASSLLPPQLYPVPTFPIHEGRIADHLPAFALDAPSLEYVQVNSVTGAAAVVAEAALKPEITLNTTKLIATASKIAAHLGLTWESIQDWDAFTASATTELQRLVIDEENAQVLGWLNATGILTHAAATGAQAVTFDDLEQAIAQLRTGPALAVADLLVLNPLTWSAIRREKDQMGRYYVAADPSRDEVNQAWGVPVVETTACPPGEGWLLDTTKFGRLAVRETLALRIGYANDDFVKNIVRYIAEERCVLTVERPAAILHITALPTVLAGDGKSSKK